MSKDYDVKTRIQIFISIEVNIFLLVYFVFIAMYLGNSISVEQVAKIVIDILQIVKDIVKLIEDLFHLLL